MNTDALPYERFLRIRGCLRAALGDDHGALRDLLATGEFSCGWGAVNPAVTPWRSDAALVAARLGNLDLARTLAAEALELARRFGAPRSLGMALRSEALVAADESTESLLAEAVSVLERSDARLEYARALVDLGAVVRRDGRHTHARDLLRCGLELAADGLTNRATAQALFVSEKTVEGHLARAYDKLACARARDCAKLSATHCPRSSAESTGFTGGDALGGCPHVADAKSQGKSKGVPLM
jgi:tetratricopeptide (TPR) repeat protein